ncbi:MAG: AraC family transcriptional regulator [Thiotrichales bacterium]
MSAAYIKRFARVLRYIDEHLDEPLAIDQLCELANFSRFHFQRQFSELIGLSISRYIQLMRLRRASYELLLDDQRKIIDIALAAGYENPESFTRAFKKSLGQTPSQFRNQPDLLLWQERMQLPALNGEKEMNVEIINFERTLVAALEHRGPKDLVLDSVRVFIDWRKESGLSPISSSRTFGIAYDDPDNVQPQDFRFDVCGEVSGPVPGNSQGITNKVIPEGRCARVMHIGSTDRIGETIHKVFRDWLPGADEELRDFPLFFEYVRRVPDVAEHEQITDIYLPLQG